LHSYKIKIKIYRIIMQAVIWDGYEQLSVTMRAEYKFRNFENGGLRNKLWLREAGYLGTGETT
jgi:hypothetical protein